MWSVQAILLPQHAYMKFETKLQNINLVALHSKYSEICNTRSRIISLSNHMCIPAPELSLQFLRPKVFFTKSLRITSIMQGLVFLACQLLTVECIRLFSLPYKVPSLFLPSILSFETRIFPQLLPSTMFVAMH
jgi:hypothetical protein